MGDSAESLRRELAKLQKLHASELDRQQKRHAGEVRQMQALMTELRDRISFYEGRVRELKDSNTALRQQVEVRNRVRVVSACADQIAVTR
jgi:chromosome segregation ATPase